MNQTHPLSDQRTASHVALVATYLYGKQESFYFDVNKVIQFSSNIFFEITINGFSRMFNKAVLEDRLLFFFSQQGIPYNNEIRKGWNTVRKNLEKTTFVRIAPEDNMLSDQGAFDYNEILNKKRGKDVDSSGEI